MEWPSFLEKGLRLWNSNGALRKLTLMILVVLFIFYISDNAPSVRSIQPAQHLLESTTLNTVSNTKSKYAYATFLSELDDEVTQKDQDDVYLTCTRMLAYQLLHDPETRTNTSIPFVVLVSPGVPQAKRQRLTNEGAMVVEFPSINMDWMKPGRERWKHVMDKLNVFQLLQFEKVLLLDSDVVIFKRLDGVFQDPATEIMTNRGKREHVKDDEGIQPSRYLMAADTAPVGGSSHKWPAARTGILNAGFVVIHPSIEVFDHYIAVAKIEGRTPGTAPENNLWVCDVKRSSI